MFQVIGLYYPTFIINTKGLETVIDPAKNKQIGIPFKFQIIEHKIWPWQEENWKAA